MIIGPLLIGIGFLLVVWSLVKLHSASRDLDNAFKKLDKAVIKLVKKD